MGRINSASNNKNKKFSVRRIPKGVVKKNAVYPNQDSDEFKRCKEWVMEQQNISDYDQDYHLQSDDDESENSQTVNKDVKVEPCKIGRIPNSVKMNFIINLACEWKSCSYELDVYDEFQKHVKQHIDDLLVEHNTQSDEDFICYWDLCAFRTKDIKHINRHIYYHIYHTHIKTLGESALERRKVPPCELESRQRNVIPDIPIDYLCQWQFCDRKYENIQEFFDHMAEHCKFEFNLRPPLPYKSFKRAPVHVNCGWINCTKSFYKLGRMMEHVRSHSKEKILACPHCGSVFSAHLKFYDHTIRQATNNSQVFPCDACYRSFASERLLRDHMYTHINSFKCALCDMTCPSPSSLTKHIRYKHVNEKPFQCIHCDFRTTFKTDLTRHISSKHEKVEYTCNELDCGYTCTTLKYMNKHIREEHGTGPVYYCCHCCSKRYKNSCNLSKHLINTHGFQVPADHSRFTYRQDENGDYRLQTMRMESLEVTEQIISPNYNDLKNNHNIVYKLSELQTIDEDGKLSISVHQTVKDNSTSESVKKQMNAKHDMSDLVTLPTEQHQEQSKNQLDLLQSDMSSSMQTIKKIDDFTVMKRYIKKGKKRKVIITVNDIDESGDIISTEVIKSNELCMKI